MQKWKHVNPMESRNMNFQRNKSDSFPEEVIKKYKKNIMYDPVMVIDLNTLVLRPSKYK